jgi:hypothetical protein
MVVYQVTVTDGGDFDAVRHEGLYRDESRAREVAIVEKTRAQTRYKGDDMEAIFVRQIVATVTPRHVL